MIRVYLSWAKGYSGTEFSVNHLNTSTPVYPLPHDWIEILPCFLYLKLLEVEPVHLSVQIQQGQNLKKSNMSFYFKDALSALTHYKTLR